MKKHAYTRLVTDPFEKFICYISFLHAKCIHFRQLGLADFIEIVSHDLVIKEQPVGKKNSIVVSIYTHRHGSGHSAIKKKKYVLFTQK